MIRRQFVARVAAKAKLTAKQVRAVFGATHEVVAAELIETGEVRVPELAHFKVWRREERPARHPQTGEFHVVGPGHTVRSRPVAKLATEVMNKVLPA